jgi:hypothetical protein
MPSRSKSASKLAESGEFELLLVVLLVLLLLLLLRTCPCGVLTPVCLPCPLPAHIQRP